ncbi:MAG: hypothetical protein ACOY5C_10240 [Pseudomonadota bacterium]
MNILFLRRTLILAPVFGLGFLPACAVSPPPPPAYGPPPAVAYAGPPVMVWVPEANAYVAYRSPYRIFFRSGNYYHYNRGQWYAGPGYSGPWSHVGPDRLPPGLLRFREEHWNRYQLEAERGYRQDGWAPGHRPFRAHPGRGGGRGR